MVTGYRFTEDEFVFLAYFYQCMTVPAWVLCEPEQIDPEKALRTLERKGMLLKNGGKNTPHPVIEYLFSQLAQACAFFGGTDRIFCYFCPQLTLAAEQSGAGVRLLPFQTPQDCFAYLRESGYAREALQPHVRYGLSDLRYQASMSGFYRLELGSHFGCACAHPDGETLVVDEILPDCSVLPALLKQLPAKQCRVRTVGGSAPFAMCKWLSDAHMPDVYLAFDFG